MNDHQELQLDLKKIRAKAATRFALFFLILAAVLFGTAGTFRYWEAWMYIATLGAGILSVTVYFYKRDPQVLERRMKTKEKEPRQQLFLKLSIPLATIVYLLPGFDKRFGWTEVPPALAGISNVVVLAAYYLFVRVLQENRFASRVIEVEAEQQIVTTGPYSVVRHPMYVSAMFIIFAARSR